MRQLFLVSALLMAGLTGCSTDTPVEANSCKLMESDILNAVAADSGSGPTWQEGFDAKLAILPPDTTVVFVLGFDAPQFRVLQELEEMGATVDYVFRTIPFVTVDARKDFGTAVREKEWLTWGRVMYDDALYGKFNGICR